MTPLEQYQSLRITNVGEITPAKAVVIGLGMTAGFGYAGWKLGRWWGLAGGLLVNHFAQKALQPIFTQKTP